MRVRALPLVSELRDCQAVPGRNEDRVVAEARVASTVRRELAVEHSAHDQLLTARCKRHDLGHHPRAPVALAGKPLEQCVGLVASG
jgi:hypothetical protein